MSWEGIVREFENAHQLGEEFRQGSYLTGSPAQVELEQQITEWRGIASIATNCGMAAIGAVLDLLLRPSCTALFSTDLYPRTRLLVESYRRWGVQVEFVDPTDVAGLWRAVQKSQPVLYFVETIGNSARMPVLPWNETIATLAESGCTLVVDTSFTPNFFPFRQDRKDVPVIEVASMSKWESVEDEVTAGRISAAPAVIKEIRQTSHYRQVTIQPTVAAQVDPGIAIDYFQDFSKHALRAAEILVDHERVEDVFYPGLSEHHSQFELAREQFDGQFGGVLYVVLRGGEETAGRFADLLRKRGEGVWQISASYGGEVWRVVPYVGVLAPHAVAPGLVRISAGLDQERGVQVLESALGEIS